MKNKNPKKKKRVVEAVKNNNSNESAPKKIDRKVEIIKLLIFGGVFVLLFLLLNHFFSIREAIVIIGGLLIIFGVARLLDRIKSKRRRKKIINTIIIVFLTVAIIIIAAVSIFFAYIVKSAPKFEVGKLAAKESTIIYDNKGQVIAELGTELRENVTYDQLPEVFIDALIATEDSRFFQHNGFDVARFAKASFGQLAGNSDAGGGSTISMQVIKNTFTSRTSTGIKGIIRKFTDIYLAVFKLEKQFTKEEIIEFYVNNHLLGNNVYGVQQASQYYFGKEAKDLNLAEASLIAGMYQSPNSYNPYTKPENATRRRKTVLSLMVRHGYITQEEADLANSVPITSLLAGQKTSTLQYQGYIDTVIEEVKAKYKVDPTTTPLLIYTNMDSAKQRALEDVFNGVTYKWKNEWLQSGVAAIDTTSGKVVAIGAGRNKTGALTFNYATMIKRQIGSTAKPLFDYAPGIEYNNFSTYTLFVDEPYSYSDGTPMNNWDDQYWGLMTLRTALVQSRNIPALKAFKQLDKKKVIAFVQALGLTPEISNGTIHEAHSIGAFTGTSPLQLAGAYQAFSNGGYYYEPYTVNKLVFRDDNETITFEPTKVQVMSDATAFMITDVLKGVVSWRMRVNGVNMAAKTGTTNYDRNIRKQYPGLPSDAIRDSWVVGYSPTMSVALWYGYDSIDKDHLDRVLHMSEASTDRLDLFGKIAQAVFDRDGKDWRAPNSVVRVGVEMGSNPAALPSSNTPANEIVYEYFKRGTEPTEISKKYAKLDNVTNLSISELSNGVRLSWSKAQDKMLVNSDTFGYYIYFNDELIGFTEKTTYTINDLDDYYGTYKVVTSYKNNKDYMSSGATVKLKKDSDYVIELIGNPVVTIKKGSSWSDSPTPFKLFEDGVDITSKIVTYKVEVKRGSTTVDSVDTNTIGTYTVTYKVTYGNYNGSISRTVIVEN